MINFLIGLAIGGVASIFIYRNNQDEISKYANKVDELYKQLDNK